MTLRRLVRAVLGPHHRVHRQFELSGLAAQELDHGGELVVGESELPVQRFAHESWRIVVKRVYTQKSIRVIEQKSPSYNAG